MNNNCKKCNEESSVLLRKKDYYCQNCFLLNTNHKFRACIGKNKLFSSNQKVLICLSGGKGSTVLLDLIYNGISLNTHKQLRVVPVFFHLIGFGNDQNAFSVIEQCNKYKFNVHVGHVSEYMQPKSQLGDIDSLPVINQDNIEQLEDMLRDLCPTALNDFMIKLKRHLFIRYANLLECNFIFTAETTTSLAISLLSNLAIGRGAQVENDVSFLDNRNKLTKILRPMKDISQEELDYYIKLNNLKIVNQANVQGTSIHSLINTFVNDLQQNFHSTISTVCKTADKIGNNSEVKCRTCIICDSDLNKRDLKLTALEATNFSRTVSFTNPQNEPGSGNTDLIESLTLSKKTMFPLIDNHLCYGCSRNHSKMKECNLPSYIHKILNNN